MNQRLKWLVPITLFFGIYILLTVLLTSPSALNAQGNAWANWTLPFLETTLPKAFFRTALVQDGSGAQTIRVQFGNQAYLDQEIARMKQAGGGQLKVDTKATGFKLLIMIIPYLFFTALVWSTPIPILRRGTAWVLGILALTLLNFWVIYIMTKYQISRNQIGIYQMGTTWMEFVQFLQATTQLGFRMLFAIFLWLLLSFRKKDWELLSARLNAIEKAH